MDDSTLEAGQIDISVNIGVANKRHFKSAFSIPSDMVRQALEVGQLNVVLSTLISKEAERVTALMSCPGKKHLTLVSHLKKGALPVPRNPHKLDCLRALISRGDYYSEIVAFLARCEAVPKPTIVSLMTPDPISKHTMLYDAIEQALLLKTLSMAHFSWVVLPKQKIQVDLVGNMEHKSFVHEEP